jgi:hypothetical protein
MVALPMIWREHVVAPAPWTSAVTRVKGVFKRVRHTPAWAPPTPVIEPNQGPVWPSGCCTCVAPAAGVPTGSRTTPRLRVFDTGGGCSGSPVSHEPRWGTPR